jgi:fructose-1,6-bisphosphatase/inositol monophosphatase family enzyme
LIYNLFIDNDAFGVSLAIADGDRPVTALIYESANMATK